MKVRMLIVALAALVWAAPASAAPALRLETSITPRPAFFGDLVTARVDVIVDSSLVDPESVRVGPSFGSWTEAAPARTETETADTLVRRSYTFTLSCLELACVPGAAPRRLAALPPVRVSARGRDGRPLAAERPWPPMRVVSRLPPSAAAAVRPAFRTQTDLPAPSFRLGPTPLALVLDLVAGLLAAAAAAVAGAELLRRRRLRAAAPDTRTPLARALAFLLEARQRSPEDRRKAAALLARTLGEDGNGLAREASKVAWSSEQPSPERLEQLARAVEQGLEER